MISIYICISLSILYISRVNVTRLLVLQEHKSLAEQADAAASAARGTAKALGLSAHAQAGDGGDVF